VRAAVVKAAVARVRAAVVKAAVARVRAVVASAAAATVVAARRRVSQEDQFPRSQG